jgi:hypothetical protein
MPEIDTTTQNNVANLTVTGLEVFANKGGGAYYPVFLKNKIERNQSF